MTEEQIQAQCVDWFHNTYHEHRSMLHHNNNNSHNRIAGARMKALGVYPGVSDFEFIDYDGIVWFIELKKPGGTQSKEQKEFQRMVEERGHPYRLIFSFEEFQELIRKIIRDGK